MRKRKLSEIEKNTKDIKGAEGDWEERLRLTPEELAEREAAAQVIVERERHRLRMEEIEASRRALEEKEAREKELAEKEKQKEQQAKRRRLTQEENRLRKSYKDLPPDIMRVADGLIRRAAFMRLTLEEYELDLAEKGYVEMFSQSKDAEPYERERPVARLYSTMNKNYQSIIKQLADLVPPAPPPPKEEPKNDAFENILERGNGD